MHVYMRPLNRFECQGKSERETQTGGAMVATPSYGNTLSVAELADTLREESELMARARRTLDRKSLREQGEAAERKVKNKEKDEAEEEEEDEEDEEEDGDEEEASGEDDDDGDSDDEDAKPKKKTKKKAAAPKKKAPAKRTRAAKVVRMKVVWAVYSNSHQLLQEFAYPKKNEAEAYLKKVTEDKKSGGPFFMQPLKKPMEKDAETPSKK